MRTFLFGCLSLLILTPAQATLEENELAEKMTAQATEFLTSMLGPGRAKVLISVEGERSNTQTQTELLTPIYTSGGQKQQQEERPQYLPGYGKEAAPKEKTWDMMQKDQEMSVRTSGLVIKKLRISVVLDSKLSDAQVGAVSKLIPDLLHINSSRGDELTFLRAEILPPWKSVLPSFLQSPVGIQTAIVLSVAIILILFALFFVGFSVYVTAMRVVRTFVSEMAAVRNIPPAPSMPQTSFPPGAPLPELLPGGIPSLTEAMAVGPQNPLPALGRRFDFLSQKQPHEIAALLAEEPPQDIALLFGYLTDSNPDMATAIFSALPQATQTGVSQSLANLVIADPERLAMLENKLRNLVEFGVRGPERLGQILSRLPASDREALISDIVATNPQAADAVGRSLFSFEDIAGLKESELRRMIMAVSYEDWGLALRGAPAELVEQVLAQLLPGTQNLVREAMDTPQPRQKVMEARSKILSHAYAMAAKGEIALGREGAASELI